MHPPPPLGLLCESPQPDQSWKQDSGFIRPGGWLTAGTESNRGGWILNKHKSDWTECKRWWKGKVNLRGKWRDFPTNAHENQIQRLRSRSSPKSWLPTSPTAFSLLAEFRPQTTCLLPLQSPPGSENPMLLKQPSDPSHKVRQPALSVFRSWPQLFGWKRCSHIREDCKTQWSKILNSVFAKLD